MNEKREYPGSLHNHTDYSNLRLRDCIIKYPDLIDKAIELGHKVVAITDHEAICCHVKALKYYQKIKKEHPDFKVILGNEIYLCRNGLNNKTFRRGEDKYYHFILLAKDAIGHEQLRELSTRAWKRSYKGTGQRRVPTYYQDLIDIIGSNPGHVIGSTACLGSAIDTQLIKYRDTQDEELYGKIKIWIRQMDSLFVHGNFFFEMQPSDSKEQSYVNKKLLELSREFDIPYIFTTDSHYLDKKDAPIHSAFLRSQDGDRETDSFYATTYMMDTQELESYLSKDLNEDEIQQGYKAIETISEMCEDYTLTKPLKIPDLPWKQFYPTSTLSSWYDKFPTLKKFVESLYWGDVELAKAIVERVEKDKTLQTKETYEAIEDNLNRIWVSSEVNKAHWSAYLLNLQNIIDCCWAANSLVLPGRGSGVGFVLLYILDITQINPLREETPTYSFRFLNPYRVSPLDVDFDIEGGRRAQVMDKFREVYGEDRVANVATFGTEKSKSAILTAARGLGIDVDVAQYISSLIPAERGITRTLSQCMYGDPDNGYEPVKQFVIEMTEHYPEIWEVAQRIEGVVNRLGIHAGGVIFVDEPFTKSTALMRAPDGTIVTAYELHDCEACSLIKYDALSVEAADKLHICLDLLAEAGYIKKGKTLKETYEDTIGVYKLERKDLKMWKMIWEHKVLSLFQMEKQSGIQGIALSHPASVSDLATLNSVIRLMAQEKGAEQPLDKFARFKHNIQEWYEEMDEYGLTKEEQKLLEPLLLPSSGICESQEGFMMLVQLPECGGFDLTWADRLRKSIAKKNPAEFNQLEKEYFDNAKEKGLSQKLCYYVWHVLVSTSKGYGFNKSHTLAYSLVALQEMNLAFKEPTIFWNCACLINDAGGIDLLADDGDEEDEDNEDEEYDDFEDFSCVEELESSDSNNVTKKKKQSRSANYGKIATAIGKICSEGVNITLPNINRSSFTFTPDAEKNVIRYGLSGISKVGHDIVKNIIANRPYNSFEDFCSKVKVNRSQAINLIKAGAFDDFGEREEIMRKYITAMTDTKKRLTLQNMSMLINKNLLPPQLCFQVKVFNFNKYLKKNKVSTWYALDEIAFNFYSKNFDLDLLTPYEEDDYLWKIPILKWDAIYKKQMDPVREYLKRNQEAKLKELNDCLIKENWDKYCEGGLAKWEMDSVSYYFHPHELANIDKRRYSLTEFINLPEEPEIDKVITIKGKQIPMLKIKRICGTVLDRDKTKKTVTLLTTTGVVTVKIFGNVFSSYDKQISEKGADGKKHVIEKSWFSRGNKIIVTGIRRGDNFIAKKYKNTPYSLVELITQVNEDGTVRTRRERADEI